VSASAAAPDPEAKRRYLASARQDGIARTAHGADIAAFLPAEPVATFMAKGKRWHVSHARNLKGLRTFQHFVAVFTKADEEVPMTARHFELLGILVGGKWKADRWVSDLPPEAADDLSRNELDELIRLGTEGDGRPRVGEAAPATPPPSAVSSPSTVASIPETPTGT
jgi:hypothetical protein